MDWYREKLHGATEQGLRIDRVLFDGKTGFQSVLIFENEFLGRVLVLDGIVQTTQADEFIYHEMLTHVALCSIEAPERVLIIGGGDGGCLEEVLKHRVKHATMVELDAEVVALCREHIPSICGDAFDDPRTELVIGDGANFLSQSKQRYDAIIIDSTDPAGPGEVLFSKAFYADCRRCLSERGILITQNGVPFEQRQEFDNSRRRFGELFRYPNFYFAAVPSYVGGAMAFGCASQGTDASAIPHAELSRRHAAAGLDTRYYNPDIHLAAFARPGYLS